MAKETLIDLEVDGYIKQFPVESADKLLRMKFNGGWKLPENSEWSWTAENGFEKRKVESGKRKADAAAENED